MKNNVIDIVLCLMFINLLEKTIGIQKFPSVPTLFNIWVSKVMQKILTFPNCFGFNVPIETQENPVCLGLNMYFSV